MTMYKIYPWQLMTVFHRLNFAAAYVISNGVETVIAMLIIEFKLSLVI